MATPKKAAAPAPAPERKQSDANRRYTEAVRRLKAKHNDEFLEILAAVYAEEGAVYKAPMTAEQRAEAKRQAKIDAARRKIAEMQAEFPELAVMGPGPDNDDDLVDPDQTTIDD